MQGLSNQQPFSSLEGLLTQLDAEYYGNLDAYCNQADLHIAALQDAGEQQPLGLYASLSSKLTGQVRQYLRLRRFALVPYIQELLDKEDSGHDCRNCATSCTIRHTAQIHGIKDVHTRIKETLYRLQSVASPLYAALEHDSNYLALRSQMMLLDTTLTKLFYLEESTLIPLVMEAQKNIHAHS